MVQKKKRKKGMKKEELTKRILLTVAGIAGLTALLGIAAIAPNSLQMLKLFGVGNQKRNVRRAANRLKRQKLVKIYEKDGQEIIEITERGKQKILKYKFEAIKIPQQKKWDNIWRIVAFDIPEKHKRARDALRMKLKKLGFLKLQQSVFIYPFQCKNEVDFIAGFFGIKKYISYIEAQKIENDDKIKNHFKI